MAVAFHRRVSEALLLCAALLSGSCGRTEGSTSPEPVIELQSGPRREGHDAILVFLPKTAETKELWDSFHQELSDEFDVIPYVVTKTTSPEEMATAIAGTRPSSVVLLNNPTVRLYQRYAQGLPASAPKLPVVILMSSFLEEFHRQIPGATGIAYEVPLITSVVNLRTFLDRKIHRVGVLARPALSRYVSRQQKLAAMEEISIIELQVDERPDDDEIAEAVDVLCSKVKIDALWVLNDNVLLHPESIASAWLPALERCSLPVIVGVGALVNPEVHFGSFAMLPDHEALGVQAADLIYELADADWRVEESSVELPLSVETTVDIAQAREYLDFKEKMLPNVDVVVD